MTKWKQGAAALVLSLAATLAALAGPVNVNTADAETLSAELKGVGITKAIAIVEYRKANGPFKSAEELTNVKGIAGAILKKNAENIIVK